MEERTQDKSGQLKIKVPNLLILFFFLVEWVPESCVTLDTKTPVCGLRIKSLRCIEKYHIIAFSGDKEEVLSRVMPSLRVELLASAKGNFVFFQKR